MAKCNGVLKLVHISSEANCLSDCLSRWHSPRKREEFYDLVGDQEVVFREVDESLFKFLHDW